jgi:hypothetical protein
VPAQSPFGSWAQFFTKKMKCGAVRGSNPNEIVSFFQTRLECVSQSQEIADVQREELEFQADDSRSSGRRILPVLVFELGHKMIQNEDRVSSLGPKVSCSRT